MKCDVCVIGAGPAGLTAAIFAAKSGASVTIVESNSTAGRKLLRTARGRCNLTHSGSVEDFVEAYNPFGRFLKHCLYEFSADDFRSFLTDLGLQSKEEKNGCVFPITNRACDVNRVLVDCARRKKVRFIYGKKVVSAEKHLDGFSVKTQGEAILCDSVIIATGGVSFSFTGSDGSGYELAQNFGHEIVQTKAALVPLVTLETLPGELQGVAIEKAGVTVVVNEKKIEIVGPIMFTGDGIGGPAVFDLSRLLTDILYASSKPIPVSIDLLPDLPEQELDKLIISKCSESPKKELAGPITTILPRSVAIKLCGMLDSSHNILAGQLPKDKRKQLIKLIKNLGLTITATHPIAEATITRGGVSTEKIDPKTMQSELCRGLFFAGEVIDVDGPCGGYNLQICWSTGALAGKEASKKTLAKT